MMLLMLSSVGGMLAQADSGGRTRRSPLQDPGPGEALPGPVGRRQPGATEEAAIYLRLIRNQEPTLAACLLIGTGR